MNEQQYEQALQVDNRIEMHCLIVDNVVDQYIKLGGDFSKYLKWDNIQEEVRLKEFKTRQTRHQGPELCFLKTSHYEQEYGQLEQNGLRDKGHHEFYDDVTEQWGVAWKESNVIKIIPETMRGSTLSSELDTANMSFAQILLAWKNTGDTSAGKVVAKGVDGLMAAWKPEKDASTGKKASAATKAKGVSLGVSSPAPSSAPPPGPVFWQAPLASPPPNPARSAQPGIDQDPVAKKGRGGNPRQPPATEQHPPKKAKTTAAPGGQTPAPAKPSGGGRGRPPIDLAKKVDDLSLEMSRADRHSSSWFGSDIKTTIKQLTGLEKDIDERFKKAQTEVESNNLQKAINSVGMQCMYV